MNLEQKKLAWSAAERLRGEFGESFPRAVASFCDPDRAEDHFSSEVITQWAALLISAATLGWTIYKDQRDRADARKQLERELKTRALEEGLEERLIDVVIVAVIESLGSMGTRRHGVDS
jgi:hypothetical protein